MKNLIFIFIFFSALKIQAQEQIDNFYNYSGKVVWVKDFVTDLPIHELIKLAEISGNIEVNAKGFDYVAGFTDEFLIDIDNIGGSTMNAPIVLSQNYFSGYLIYKAMEGKYRIIFKNIKLRDKRTGELSTFESVFLKKAKFRNNFNDVDNYMELRFMKKFKIEKLPKL